MIPEIGHLYDITESQHVLRSIFEWYDKWYLNLSAGRFRDLILFIYLKAMMQYTDSSNDIEKQFRVIVGDIVIARSSLYKPFVETFVNDLVLAFLERIKHEVNTLLKPFEDIEIIEVSDDSDSKSNDNSQLI